VTSVKTPTSLSDIILGPNPVEGTLFIENKGTKKYTLQLVNSLGQSVDQIEVSASSNASLNVQDLNAGIYIVYANGLFAEKIVLR
jgi:hypothetical protein